MSDDSQNIMIAGACFGGCVISFFLACGIAEWIHMSNVADGDPYGLWGDPEFPDFWKEVLHIESWGSWEGTLEGNQDFHHWTDNSEVLHINIIDGTKATTPVEVDDAENQVDVEGATDITSFNIQIFTGRESDVPIPVDTGTDTDTDTGSSWFGDDEPEAPHGELVSYMVIHEHGAAEAKMIEFRPTTTEGSEVQDLYDDITERFNYYNTGEEGMHWNDASKLQNFMDFDTFQDLVGDLNTTQEGSTLHSAQQYRTKDMLVDFGDTWDYVHGDNSDIIGYKFQMPSEVTLDLPSEAVDPVDPKPAVDGEPAVDAVPAQKEKDGLLTFPGGAKFTVDRETYNALVDKTEPPWVQDDQGKYFMWGRPVESMIDARPPKADTMLVDALMNVYIEADNRSYACKIINVNDNGTYDIEWIDEGLREVPDQTTGFILYDFWEGEIGWYEEGLLSEYVEPVQEAASAAGDPDPLDLNGPLAVQWMEDNPNGTAKQLLDYLNHAALPDHTGHNHDRRRLLTMERLLREIALS